jgi:hypothetical protein
MSCPCRVLGLGIYSIGPDHGIGAQRVLEHESGKYFISIALPDPGYGLQIHEIESPLFFATKAISLS